LQQIAVRVHAKSCRIYAERRAKFNIFATFSYRVERKFSTIILQKGAQKHVK